MKNVILTTLAFGTALSCQAADAPSCIGASNKSAQNETFIPLAASVSLMETPNQLPQCHQTWIDAINGARSSIRLEMFHLTDTAVVNALINKGQNKAIDIQIILDGSSLTDHNSGYYKQFARLQSALGAQNVVASSPSFSITHEKTMVIDEETAYITSINLTNLCETTRDWGVITTDRGIIQEIDSVFAADLVNARSSAGCTPALIEPSLVWSPVNSQGKLTALIESGKTLCPGGEIDATTETFEDAGIALAMVDAVKAGMTVKLIVPECDQIPNGALTNYAPIAETLKKLGNRTGFEARVMPNLDPPASQAIPYMHAKMINVCGKTAYLGSVNLTNHSTETARELGVIFSDQAVIKKISQTFASDWTKAIPVPDLLPACPAVK